ncbi:MAG: tetratricopeptide repeat protein [Polyangia bacterium]
MSCQLAGCSERTLLFSEAIDAVETGRTDRALEIWRSLLEEHPDDPELLGYLGWTLYRTGETNRALEVLERARSLCDDEALERSLRLNIEMVTAFRRGSSALRHGDPRGALIIFEDLAERFGENAVVLDQLASALSALGREDEAREAWEKITSLLSAPPDLARRARESLAD